MEINGIGSGRHFSTTNSNQMNAVQTTRYNQIMEDMISQLKVPMSSKPQFFQYMGNYLPFQYKIGEEEFLKEKIRQGYLEMQKKK